MRRCSICFGAIIVLLASFSFVFAGESTSRLGPASLQVQMTINRVQELLRDDALSKEERSRLINQTALERFDFYEMSRRMVKNRWNVSREKQEEFIALFTELLELNYLNKIDAIKDAVITYPKTVARDNKVAVYSSIGIKRGGTYDVMYRLHLVGDEWRIYDIVFEGISIVRNYREQFNTMLQRGSTIDDLMKQVRVKIEREKSKQ